MRVDGALDQRVIETLQGYWALGNECIDLGLARFVRNRSLELIHDANLCIPVQVGTPSEIDELLQCSDEIYAGYADRKFVAYGETHGAFAAHLVCDGYELSTEVELLLEAELQASPRALEIRCAETDRDWDELFRLLRLEHEEDQRRFGEWSFTEEVSRAMLASYRAKCPPMRFWIAREDGIDCGFFSSWPGENGIGKIEALFTREEFRGRGVATALISRAVEDARERGAGPIVIGARTNDWPKVFYRKLGFRPILLQYEFHKRVAPT